ARMTDGVDVHLTSSVRTIPALSQILLIVVLHLSRLPVGTGSFNAQVRYQVTSTHKGPDIDFRIFSVLWPDLERTTPHSIHSYVADVELLFPSSAGQHHVPQRVGKFIL